MQPVNVNDCVTLEHDFPELGLSRGDVGVVRRAWVDPASREYEVEFASAVLQHRQTIVALIPAHHVRPAQA